MDKTKLIEEVASIINDEFGEVDWDCAEDKSTYITAAKAAISVIAPAYEAEIARLQHELKSAVNNKDDMAKRNALLRERHDLPVDRIPAHRELERLQKQVDAAKDVRGLMDANVKIGLLTTKQVNPDLHEAIAAFDAVMEE